MVGRTAVAAALMSAALVTGPMAAAQPQDPDWPCVQRKVPTLTVAQMWTGPAPAADWEDRAEIGELARRLAARRVPVADVTAAAADFAADVDPDQRGEALASLFAAILERLNAERGEITAGIGRYARRQTAEAARVDAMRRDLADLEAAPADTRDDARIEELRTALVWETRIFKERSQSLSYVCETPVLIERRAFEIGRAFTGLI
jgi:hypothetical protein